MRKPILIKQKQYSDVLYPTHTDDVDNIRGKTTTVSTSGCGLCSAMMVVQLITDRVMTVEEAIEISFETGANHATGTSMRLFAPLFSERYGFEYLITDDMKEMLKCLNSHGVVIVHVAGYDGYECTFSSNGHYIVAFHYNEQSNEVAILDPSFSKEKYNTEERKKRTRIDGEIVWVRPEVLHKDTDARSPRRYYLFWNKARIG